MPPSPAQRRINRPPILTALAAQALAAVVCIGFAALARRTGLVTPTWPIILAVQGGIAAALGLGWGLPRWWLPLNLVAPLALAAGLALGVATWVFPIILGFMVLVFWNSAGDRVPLYLSNQATWKALAEVLPPPQGERLGEVQGGVFIDLGAGLGGTLAYLARRRPDMAFFGVETAPIPFALSWLRLRFSGLSNVKIHYGNLWNTDLSTARVVYTFLSPAPMARLFSKIQREMAPDTIFISNSFDVPDIAPDEIHKLPDRRQTRLLIWHL